LKSISILSRQQEFLTKIKIVADYFLFHGGLPAKVRKHLEAIKVLSAYRREDLIFFRAYFIYILPYISKALSVQQKHQILIGHYSFLREKFSAGQLQQLFNHGIEYYREADQQDTYRIVLQAVTDHLEFEGSMYLYVKLNERRIFTLSFTFVPGNIFGFEDQRIIFISSVQGTKNEFDQIRKATRYFKDNALPSVLIKVLEAIAVSLNIDKFLGIAASDQLSYKSGLSYERFYANYDTFWLSMGGVSKKGYYSIALPLQQKPILQISQTHRNRTLKKRKKLEEIFEVTAQNSLDKLRQIA
jgi:uncharacterized protein VirK/YbjX